MMEMVTITKTCIFCGTVNKTVLSAKEYMNWQMGDFLQIAAPRLSADDREKIISGTCAKCWEAM